MFRIFAVSNLLQWLILMPVSYTALQFVLPPYFALLLSGMVCALSLLACWLCKLSLKAYLYKLISFAISLLTALILAKGTIGAVLIFAFCLLVFILTRKGINFEKDISSQVAFIGLIINIPLALFNVSNIDGDFTKYCNAAIFVSTIASIVLLILIQVDESRRFGNNDMSISATQRKNNQVFGGVIIILLLVFGSTGQVSNIYSLVFNIFKKFLQILGYLLTPVSTGETRQLPNQMQDVFKLPAAEEPSLFSIIIQTILYALAVILIVAMLGLAIYFIAKMIIKLMVRLINWLRNKEQIELRFCENDHIDEKKSLYNKNLQKLAKRISSAAKGIFERDIPYSKLPDEKAKVRRLFKYFMNKAKNEGVSTESTSTAEEICRRVSDISPETMDFNNLMSKCYGAARYGDLPPTPEDLEKLQSRLLK